MQTKLKIKGSVARIDKDYLNYAKATIELTRADLLAQCPELFMGEEEIKKVQFEYLNTHGYDLTQKHLREGLAKALAGKIAEEPKSTEENNLTFYGHIEKKYDNWNILVHLPNSGMLLDMKTCDLIGEPKPKSTETKCECEIPVASDITTKVIDGKKYYLTQTFCKTCCKPISEPSLKDLHIKDEPVFEPKSAEECKHEWSECLGAYRKCKKCFELERTDESLDRGIPATNKKVEEISELDWSKKELKILGEKTVNNSDEFIIDLLNKVNQLVAAINRLNRAEKE